MVGSKNNGYYPYFRSYQEYAIDCSQWNCGIPCWEIRLTFWQWYDQLITKRKKRVLPRYNDFLDFGACVPMLIQSLNGLDSLNIAVSILNFSVIETGRKGACNIRLYSPRRNRNVKYFRIFLLIYTNPHIFRDIFILPVQKDSVNTCLRPTNIFLEWYIHVHICINKICFYNECDLVLVSYLSSVHSQ